MFVYFSFTRFAGKKNPCLLDRPMRTKPSTRVLKGTVRGSSLTRASFLTPARAFRMQAGNIRDEHSSMTGYCDSADRRHWIQAHPVGAFRAITKPVVEQHTINGRM